MNRPTFPILMFAIAGLIVSGCSQQSGQTQADAGKGEETTIEARVPVEIATARRAPVTQAFQGTASFASRPGSTGAARRPAWCSRCW